MNSSFLRRFQRLVVLAISLLSFSGSVLADPSFDSFFSNNGSFEFGSSNPPLSFSSNFSTNDSITGWRMSAIGSQPYWFEGANAEAGNRYIELTATGGLASWHSGVQIINGLAPFVIGEHYLMSFWAAGGVGSFSSLDLAFGSTSTIESFTVTVPHYTQAEFDALNGLQWQRHTVEFIAGDTSMNFNVFANNSGVVGQNSSIFLDNFSIAAVPEPGSLLLAGMAGVMAITARRRRYA